MTVASSGSEVGGKKSVDGILAANGAPQAEGVRTVDLNSITVVKRSGSLVPFRKERIARAIELAFRATKGIAETAPLPQDIQTVVHGLTEQVAQAVSLEAAKGACVTVEGIQDLVEVKLVKGGYFDVGRNYIIYRNEQKATREDSPRNVKILRRDGKTLVRFNPMKIASAIESAFRASLKIEGQTPDETIANVNALTDKVVARVVEVSAAGTQVDIETIQDEVERQMMASGFYQVAKDFILYRSTRAAQREVEVETEEPTEAAVEVAPGTIFKAVTKEGTQIDLAEGELRKRIVHACKGLESIASSEEVLQEAVRNFYEGIKLEEVDQAVIMAARAKIEKDPGYSYVAARLLLDIIYRETMGVDAHNSKLEKAHQQYFKDCLKKAVSVERMDPSLLEFDLDKLGQALKLDRDF
jgi:ribonucleoside-diphosphate reductase alpha chain